MKSPEPPVANAFPSVLLFATIALAPLPFGSTDAPVVSVWCVVVGVALAGVRPIAMQRGHALLLGLALLVVAGYAVVLHEQMAERPWFAVSQPHPIWRETSVLLNNPLPGVATVARNQPWLSLGPPLAMILTLLVSFLVSLQRDRARQLINVVAWSGLAYAVLGIALYAADPTRVLWRDKQAYTNVLTATFINRNTAAIYFGSCSVIWLLLICERVSRLLPSSDASLRGIWREVQSRPRRLALPASALALCVAAMLLTGSRAGVVISLASMTAAPALFFRRRWSGTGKTVAAVAIGIAVALLVLETVGAGVSSRFDTDRLVDGGRLEAYRSTLRIIADHAWLGTGIGTFPWVFPEYRSAVVSSRGVWDRAHNTLLELTSEVGIPLSALVAFAWIVVLVILVRGAVIRRRDRILPTAAFLIGGAAIVHSLIDFSLQIPGFAITVAGVLGAGLAQSFRSPKGAGGPGRIWRRPAAAKR